MTTYRSPLTDDTRSSVSRDVAVRKIIFRTYALCIFTMVFCVNAPAPLFELFRRTIGLSPSKLSMLYAVYAGIVIVALPYFGRASDRFGRRALVVLGLGFIAFGSLVLTAAGSFSWLIVGRLLQGLGIAAMSAPAAAALAELVGEQSQASAALTMALALAVGGASAPLFSGVTAEAFPAFPTLPLLFCTAMAFAGLVSVALLPDPWTLRQRQNTPFHSQIPALVAALAPPLKNGKGTDCLPTGDGSSRVVFWQACAAVVACFGAQTTFFTISGPLFGTLLASHVLLAAGCAMSTLMVASGLGAMLATCLSGKAAVATGMGLLAPGVCGFFGLAGVVPLLALTPAVVAIGLSHGLGYAGAMRLINETAHSASRAAYMSKFYLAVYVGGGLPVLGMGIAEGSMGRRPASMIFSLIIAFIAIGLLASLWLTDRHQTPKSTR